MILWTAVGVLMISLMDLAFNVEFRENMGASDRRKAIKRDLWAIPATVVGGFALLVLLILVSMWLQSTGLDLGMNQPVDEAHERVGLAAFFCVLFYMWMFVDGPLYGPRPIVTGEERRRYQHAADVKVFLSYRRSDSKGDVDLICPALQAALGRENVFRDLDTIPLRVRWADYIRDWLHEYAPTVLVVIGPGWADAGGAGGGLRLEDPDDMLRNEIEEALALGLRVIPVRVRGAAVPGSTSLPASIAAISGLPPFNVRSGEHFASDVDALIHKAILGRFSAIGKEVRLVTAPGKFGGRMIVGRSAANEIGTIRAVLPTPPRWLGILESAYPRVILQMPDGRIDEHDAESCVLVEDGSRLLIRSRVVETDLKGVKLRLLRSQCGLPRGFDFVVAGVAPLRPQFKANLQRVKIEVKQATPDSVKTILVDAKDCMLCPDYPYCDRPPMTSVGQYLST